GRAGARCVSMKHLTGKQGPRPLSARSVPGGCVRHVEIEVQERPALAGGRGVSCSSRGFTLEVCDLSGKEVSACQPVGWRDGRTGCVPRTASSRGPPEVEETWIETHPPGARAEARATGRGAAVSPPPIGFAVHNATMGKEPPQGAEPFVNSS